MVATWGSDWDTFNWESQQVDEVDSSIVTSTVISPFISTEFGESQDTSLQTTIVSSSTIALGSIVDRASIVPLLSDTYQTASIGVASDANLQKILASDTIPVSEALSTDTSNNTNLLMSEIDSSELYSQGDLTIASSSTDTTDARASLSETGTSASSFEEGSTTAILSQTIGSAAALSKDDDGSIIPLQSQIFDVVSNGIVLDTLPTLIGDDTEGNGIRIVMNTISPDSTAISLDGVQSLNQDIISTVIQGESTSSTGDAPTISDILSSTKVTKSDGQSEEYPSLYLGKFQISQTDSTALASESNRAIDITSLVQSSNEESLAGEISQTVDILSAIIDQSSDGISFEEGSQSTLIVSPRIAQGEAESLAQGAATPIVSTIFDTSSNGLASEFDVTQNILTSVFSAIDESLADDTSENITVVANIFDTESRSLSLDGSATTNIISGSKIGKESALTLDTSVAQSIVSSSLQSSDISLVTDESIRSGAIITDTNSVESITELSTNQSIIITPQTSDSQSSADTVTLTTDIESSIIDEISEGVRFINPENTYINASISTGSVEFNGELIDMITTPRASDETKFIAGAAASTSIRYYNTSINKVNVKDTINTKKDT